MEKSYIFKSRSRLYEPWWSNLSFHLRSLESSKGHKLLLLLPFPTKNHRFDPIFDDITVQIYRLPFRKEGIDNIACHLTFYPFFPLRLNLWLFM